MNVLLLLFACYGLTFGLMNKIPTAIHDKLSDHLHAMLRCSYCTGFHAGWFVFVCTEIADCPPDLTIHGIAAFVIHMLMWAFASSAFCFAADVTTQWVESRIPQ